MIQKIVPAILGLVLLFHSAVAQTYTEEALLFSRTQPGGTARVNAMGGVQNALGGDLSTASYNPAGLGMYNRSEFSISPGLSIYSSSSNYLGTNSATSQTHAMIPNLGVALHSAKPGSTGFLGGTFAISYNRLNDFNNTLTYKGTNPDNSIIDYFIENANGTDSTQFAKNGFNYNTPTGLGYFNYLIGPTSLLNPANPKDQYFTDVSGIPSQTETIKNSGSQNQWNLSYGANFSDKFYIGAGIGFTNFDYKSEKTYTETFDQVGQPMTKMQLNETLSLSGTGINFTMGTIIRPIDQFQFGLSATTPTSYSVTDNYTAFMSTNWNNFEYLPGLFINQEQASTDLLTTNYNLKTPWRVTGGATVFIEKRGFVSADVEWVDYGSAAYNSSLGDDWSADNANISGLYKSVFNIRIGGEYRWNNYRFRGGYSLMPDPHQTEQNGVSAARTSYTTGAGYRTDKFYVDLAVIFASGSSTYRPYTVNLPNSPVVTFDNKPVTFMLTLGLPFN